MQIQKGFCKIFKDSRDIAIFVRTPFAPKFLAFHSALPIDVYLPFAPLPAISHYFSSSVLPFFLPINFLMYRYASRVASIRLDLAIFDSRRRILYNIHRVAYRYIRKLIGRKKGSREIMRNGREGGERPIYVNRQRRMKCQKFWWKSGSHENRDISGILQYFAKPFLDLHRRRNGLHFLLISFFLRPNIRQKAMETEGTLRDFLIFHDFQS